MAIYFGVIIVLVMVLCFIVFDSPIPGGIFLGVQFLGCGALWSSSKIVLVLGNKSNRWRTIYTRNEIYSIKKTLRCSTLIESL